MYNPFEVEIQNQADDEEILKVWRHHPITLIKPVLRVLAFAIIPLGLLLFTQFSMFTNPWLFGLYLLILAIVLTYAAYEWVSWYGDVYVLTNYRIIDVEQHGFFHRNFAEASLSKIQDVTYEISGVLQTFFNFGNTVVQTAGAHDVIKIEDVPKPQDQALYLLQAFQKHRDDTDDSLSADELIRLLTKHRKDLEGLAEMEKKEKSEKIDERVDELTKKVKKRTKPPKEENKTTKVGTDPFETDGER